MATAADPASVAPIPGSLGAACVQAQKAAALAATTGIRRMFVEIDTTGGDATYTMLKNSIPVTRLLLPLLDGGGRVVVLWPDSGAAALVRRDWDQTPDPPLPPSLALLGLEEADVDATADAGVMIVAPRASEVETLESAVNSAKDLPVVIVNPDLVDMGVTGLSLNARRLRARLIDTFEVVYYLKVFNWGVVLRAFPGKWGLWVDEPDSEVGFRLIAELDSRPSAEDIDNALDDDAEANESGRTSSGMLTKLGRFLKLYMRG